jgi:hypothetical protein
MGGLHVSLHVPGLWIRFYLESDYYTIVPQHVVKTRNENKAKNSNRKRELQRMASRIPDNGMGKFVPKSKRRRSIAL